MTRWRVFCAVYVILTVLGGVLVGPLPIAELMIPLSAVTAWTYVLWYALTARWYASSIGIQLISLAFFVALLTTVSLIPESLGFDGALRAWVALFVLGALPLLMLNKIRVLRAAQRQGLRKKEANDTQEA